MYYQKTKKQWWSAVVDKDDKFIGLVSASSPDKLHDSLRSITRKHRLHGEPFTGLGKVE